MSDFYQREVVGRSTVPQLQMGEKVNYMTLPFNMFRALHNINFNWINNLRNAISKHVIKVDFA